MQAMIFVEEAGPNAELNWLFLLFLGFFLLIVIVGWLVGRGKGEPPEVQEEVHVHPEAPVAHEEPIVPDDLTRLEGIGPKVSRVLNEAGISTFKSLAHANAADIQKALSAEGLQMMNPEGWIEQAALAANGDWVGLEKLQSELKGGRRK